MFRRMWLMTDEVVFCISLIVFNCVQPLMENNRKFSSVNH